MIRLPDEDLPIICPSSTETMRQFATEKRNEWELIRLSQKVVRIDDIGKAFPIVPGHRLLH